MIISRDISSGVHKARLHEAGCVLTIGNFDGLHRGHQKMLITAKNEAKRLHLPLAVLSFDPHPATYFSQTTLVRLDSFGERVLGFEKLNVDLACIVPFGKEMAKLSPQEFFEYVIHRDFNAKTVLIGDDFRYGNKREGSIKTLRIAAEKHDMRVEQILSVKYKSQRVSSTIIRSHLKAGRISQANDYLDRKYSMMGRVNHGDERGRQWGFPTLNLNVGPKRAVKGVYVVRVMGLDDKPIDGVANLGARPTVDGLKTLLEVHLFDFDRLVYGQRVCVEFYEKIRSEKKFDSFGQLKKQIQEDVVFAKNYFKRCL